MRSPKTVEVAQQLRGKPQGTNGQGHQAVRIIARQDGGYIGLREMTRCRPGRPWRIGDRKVHMISCHLKPGAQILGQRILAAKQMSAPGDIEPHPTMVRVRCRPWRIAHTPFSKTCQGLGITRRVTRVHNQTRQDGPGITQRHAGGDAAREGLGRNGCDPVCTVHLFAECEARMLRQRLSCVLTPYAIRRQIR